MAGPASSPPAFSPSSPLLAQMAAELRQHAPFSLMNEADVAAFVAAAEQTYHASGEVVASPGDGPAPRLYFIRRGAVVGKGGVADFTAEGGMHYEAGDLFPAAAVAGSRSVTASYEAADDLFCLSVSAEVARELARRSAPWADFLAHRAQRLLELSLAALQAEQGALALSEHSLEAPLARLPRKEPVAVPSGTPLIDALRLMNERRVGSVMVLSADGRAEGILTRHDVLERVALAQPAATTPIDQVASRPVATLPIANSAQAAVLLMSRLGIRHLPLVEPDGRVVSIISERDLFGLQRLSLKHVGATIRAATDRAALVRAAAEIRAFARHLVAQGLGARSVTEMISHLNDLLTERLVGLVCAEQGLDLARACWLAFGSEGRNEQTIATDQDNGWVLADDMGAEERARWLRGGQAVNGALDACGYPLCKGNVMAGNPDCCLTLAEWRARFERWMDGGTPEDLLNASIYFDLRPIAGARALAAPLRETILRRARELPRFRKMLADNSLRAKPALNWRGALDAKEEGAAAWVDLKLGGTALFVDAARLLALAHGVDGTSTRERLLGAAAALGQSGQSLDEAEGWAGAFEVLQMLRLHQQIRPDADAAAPNRVDINRLGAIDRRLLKEALHAARSLQQRIAMDYPG
jgi:CBS domain-containing protein